MTEADSPSMALVVQDIATSIELGPRGDRGPAQFTAMEGNVARSQIRRLNCANVNLPW